MKEMVGGCCVCSDERGWPDNPLVYCDGNGCTVAVHQACYGIVTVPTGPWYCRKCESPETKGKVRCELCPSKSGALKRADTGGWAHVVCALYIPEVRFGNVTSMEPIVLRLIPPERYNKNCYICQESGKTHRATAGACMQCNKSGCKQQFHVTCAQSLGLLCEEAGNYLDNVKYCGYCQHHYSKLPGRKSGGVSGKNTPNSSKTPTNTPQPTDKKKPSPSRRGSSATEGGSGSKGSTPAPSPQHQASDAPPPPNKPPGGSTPGSTPKASLPATSPSSKSTEAVGVISSVASATSVPLPAITPTPPSLSASSATGQAPAKPLYQESVITNTDCADTKQTKKRKAVTAAGTPTPLDYAPTPPPTAVSDMNSQSCSSMWEGQLSNDVQMDNAEKIIKKAKTEAAENLGVSHFSSVSAAPPPPPPPPAHSPAAQPSPRHLPSPMPGPSGGNPAVTNIRSPSHPQGVKSERDGPASLLVSVPLSSTSHGLNLSAQAQAAMDPGISHSPHGVPARSSWGGLNVAYEMQQDPNKPSVSCLPGSSKDGGLAMAGMGGMPPVTVRNKKRAAMASSVVTMASNPTTSTIQSAAQSLASIRRQPQPTPPPIYQETIKDSPPSSPSSERPLKPKLESKMGGGYSAPHMLGNELNPESGAAARLQEQLSAELAAHAAGGAGLDPLVPPPLINKAAPFLLQGASSRSGSGAQSLDQLLERQWEQGSQFLMEQAQHFDIASLLSCLHQLRTENVRLEEHVGSLLQRRDHLLAVNARLAIPLTAVPTGPPEPRGCARENGGARGPPAPVRPAETITSERGHQLMMREVQQKPS
ncbi:protein AF-10 isoform X4 [Cydia amplana]|uniref:protein AF-10 isoform X4 n=1 Tax=Cydia amplana TaxID=1869771 RepID=UPI002FE610CD